MPRSRRHAIKTPSLSSRKLISADSAALKELHVRTILTSHSTPGEAKEVLKRIRELQKAGYLVVVAPEYAGVTASTARNLGILNIMNLCRANPILRKSYASAVGSLRSSGIDVESDKSLNDFISTHMGNHPFQQPLMHGIVDLNKPNSAPVLVVFPESQTAATDVSDDRIFETLVNALEQVSSGNTAAAIAGCRRQIEAKASMNKSRDQVFLSELSRIMHELYTTHYIPTKLMRIVPPQKVALVIPRGTTHGPSFTAENISAVLSFPYVGQKTLPHSINVVKPEFIRPYPNIGALNTAVIHALEKSCTNSDVQMALAENLLSLPIGGKLADAAGANDLMHRICIALGPDGISHFFEEVARRKPELGQINRFSYLMDSERINAHLLAAVNVALKNKGLQSLPNNPEQFLQWKSARNG